MTENMNSEQKYDDGDRLSSLPDAIITDILSLLPINNAAATSVLSHRWRRLWTTVTRLEIDTDAATFITSAAHILAQLNSPKLRAFHLSLSSVCDRLESDDIEAIYREVCRRNVESVFVDLGHFYNVCYFFLPVCFFNTQSIVILELICTFRCDSDGDKIGGVELPNLKKLRLDHLYYLPSWLGNLFRCCPRLEDLDLGFQLDIGDEIAESVDICAPNLKLLKIDLEFVGQTDTERINISIDAPELECLTLRDCFSFYVFDRSPTRLVRASIDLIRDVSEEHKLDWIPSSDYLRHISKFIGGMCSVSSLDLKLESKTNILTHLSSVGDGFLPVFRNLAKFEITLDGIGVNGWKDLILSLHCFPNLNHLEVNMEGDDPSMEQLNDWSAPGSVPDCLVSKMKTVQIRGLIGIDDDLKLLAYILSSAAVLNELHVCMRNDFSKDLLWRERKFRMSLFDLPRSSSTCEVVLRPCHCYSSRKCK